MLPAWPWCPAVDTITMMLPRVPRSTIRRATCLVHRNVPVRFTASWRCQRSSGMSSTLWPPRMPALLTSTSAVPQASRTRATMASTCRSSVTSHVRPSACPTRAVMAAAHCCALSASTSTHTTRAPSAASPSAMPPPMLGLVPVTIATFPASFMRARDYNRRPGGRSNMPPRVPWLVLPAVVWMLIGCHAAAPPPGPSRSLTDLARDYDREVAPYFPLTASEAGLHEYDRVLANDIGETYRRGLLDVCTRYRDALTRLDRARLDGGERVTYDVFL